jgi:ABC-type uncharacterized transport system substrate-binding protein
VQRRDFLLLALGTAIPWNPAVAAARTPRIGFIGAGSAVANRGFLDALWDGLRALGWTDGNLVILDRWAEEHTEQLPSIADELVDAAVDILVTVGTLATLAATRATKTTPTVMIGVGDPVAVGAVKSLAQPGGNVTGLSLGSIEVIAQRLRLLQQVMPGRGRVAWTQRSLSGPSTTCGSSRPSFPEVGALRSLSRMRASRHRRAPQLWSLGPEIGRQKPDAVRI